MIFSELESFAVYHKPKSRKAPITELRTIWKELDALLDQPEDQVDELIAQLEQLVKETFPQLDTLIKREIVSAVVMTAGVIDIGGVEQKATSSIETCQNLQTSIAAFVTEQRQRLLLTPASIVTPIPTNDEIFIRWVVDIKVPNPPAVDETQAV